MVIIGRVLFFSVCCVLLCLLGALIPVESKECKVHADCKVEDEASGNQYWCWGNRCFFSTGEVDADDDDKFQELITKHISDIDGNPKKALSEILGEEFKNIHRVL